MHYRSRTLPCRLSFVPSGTLPEGLEGVEPFPSFSLLPAFALGGGALDCGDLGPWLAGIQNCGDLAKIRVSTYCETGPASGIYMGSEAKTAEQNKHTDTR